MSFVDSNDSSTMDTFNEILQELEEDILIVFTMSMIACNSHNLFNLNKLEEGTQQTFNHSMRIMHVLGRMHKVFALFKILSNFGVHEFDEFVCILCVL